MTRRREHASSSAATPLALAVARGDWDAAALRALLAFARAARRAPCPTLEDLLAAIAPTEDAHDRP